MSKRVILIAAAAIAAVTWTAPAKAEVSDIEKKACSDSYTIAMYAMSMRQNDYSIFQARSTMQKLSLGYHPEAPALQSSWLNLGYAMINLAYNSPVWLTQEFKDQEMRKFANDQELRCYKIADKD